MARHPDPSDDEAFGAFVEVRRAKLLKVARHVTGDVDEAEDVVQETLLAVWKRRDAIGEGKLEAYLFRAVKLNALQRRMRRRKPLSLDSIAEPARREADESEDPYDLIGPVELEELIEDLPEPQKAVLRMKYYLGMSFRQIGHALAVSRNTVASRCRYALAALRKAFGGSGGRTDRS
jgi:RNA polymerase sigma-70 factor (ECF subfamily)